MSNSHSFIMYSSWATMFANLPDEQAGELIKAICSKQLGVKYEINDPVVAGVFAMIATRMDEDSEKYRQTCEKRSEAGKKGSQKRWEESQNIASDCKCDNEQSQNVANVADTDTDTDTDNKKEKDKREKRTASRPMFHKPTVEEVAQYCRERGNGVSAEQFVSWYESNGWKVGKNPMKDWKAAVRTWEQRDTARSGTTGSGIAVKKPSFNHIEQHDYDFDAIEKMLGG